MDVVHEEQVIHESQGASSGFLLLEFPTTVFRKEVFLVSEDFAP
jgi:hypothetical protein